MSKGWESKSVEEQQAERAAMVETKAKGRSVDGSKARARQALELQREQIRTGGRRLRPHWHK
jgi:hypothetical protein